MPNNTEDVDATPEALHIIESAYQDVQGVYAQKKGYRLRANELALAIDNLIQQEANRQKAELLDRLEPILTTRAYKHLLERHATLLSAIEAERKQLEKGEK